MKRSFSSIALAVTIALTAAACSTQLDSDSPNSSETPAEQPASTTSNKSSAAGVANLLASQGVSEAELKESLETAAQERTDWQITLTRANCLAGLGWEVTVDAAYPDRVQTKAKGQEQFRKHAADTAQCDESLGHNSLTPPNAEDIRAQYKLDMKRQECLKAEGLVLTDLPSEATYVETILDSLTADMTPDFQTPKDQLGQLIDDPAELRRLSIKCINRE